MKGVYRPAERPAKLEAARAAWREIITELRRAPVRDAEQLAEQIRRELAEAFPERGTR